MVAIFKNHYHVLIILAYLHIYYTLNQPVDHSILPYSTVDINRIPPETYKKNDSDIDSDSEEHLNGTLEDILDSSDVQSGGYVYNNSKHAKWLWKNERLHDHMVYQFPSFFNKHIFMSLISKLAGKDTNEIAQKLRLDKKLIDEAKAMVTPDFKFKLPKEVELKDEKKIVMSFNSVENVIHVTRDLVNYFDESR